MAQVHYVRQPEAKGLGHAVLTARRHVGHEPFAVLLPDDLMHERAGLLEHMLRAHAELDRSVVALMEVSPAEISAYGCAAVEPVEGQRVRVTSVVEKPPAAEAPSNLAVIGRYVLTPDIFDALERVVPGSGGEIQLTDAIAMLIDDGVYGYTFSEGRFDTGNKNDYLRAVVELAIEREDIGASFRAFLRDLVARGQLEP